MARRAAIFYASVPPIDAEIEACERHVALLREGMALRDFCRRHGIALPPGLMRLLDMAQPARPVIDLLVDGAGI